MPYLSRRPVQYSFELHQVFHAPYTQEMRWRMLLLSSAYYSTDPDSVQCLRRRYEVTHLIVDLAFFRKPRPYFAPFASEDDFSGGRSKGFFLPSVIGRTKVFRSGDTVVLDLSRI